MYKYLSALLLFFVACSGTSEHDSNVEQSKTPLEASEQTLATLNHRVAVLSINEVITQHQFNDTLNQLRELDILPTVALPGNVLMLTGQLRHFDPRHLGVKASLHKRTTDGQWDHEPDVESQWHRKLNEVDTSQLLLNESHVATLKSTIKSKTQRPLSFTIAAAVIDDFDGEKTPEVEPEGHPPTFTLTDALHDTQKVLDGFVENSKTRPTMMSDDDVLKQHQWIEKKRQAIQNHQRSPTFQGPKFGLQRIALAFFFPESQNVGNEDWTQGGVNTQMTFNTRAAMRFVQVAPTYTNLFFDFVIFDFGDTVNDISYEPTDGVNEQLWIGELLGNTGIPGNIFGHHARNQMYEEFLAQALNANHATAIYTVKDAENPRADFNDSTRTGWPHAYSNGYGTNNSQFGGATFLHELLHTLNAADQYSGSNGSNPCINRGIVGHDRANWAGAHPSYTNGNHVDCNRHGTTHDSIMQGSNWTSSMDTQVRPALDWYTRASIGWGNTAQALAHVTVPNAPTGPVFDPPLYVRLGNSRVEGAPTDDKVSVFRYTGLHQVQSARSALCVSMQWQLGSWLSAPSFWFPQYMSIIPTAQCDAELNNTISIGGGGPSEINDPTPSALNPTIHEGRIHHTTQIYEPAASINMDCTAPVNWRDGYNLPPINTPMGCYVRTVPHGTKPFIWNNNYYVEYHNYCPIGSDMGTTCEVLPYLNLSYTTFYISNDKKQAYAVNSYHPTQCPIGSYVVTIQNMALCHVATTSTMFYVDDPKGPLFSTKDHGCSIGVDDTANCHLGTPPANTVPKLDHQRFYYTR